VGERERYVGRADAQTACDSEGKASVSRAWCCEVRRSKDRSLGSVCRLDAGAEQNTCAEVGVF
jgi:hypothetical protein